MHPRIHSVLTNHLLIKFSSCVHSSAKLPSYRFFHTSEWKFQVKITTMARPSVYVTRKLTDEAMKLLSKTCEVTFWAGTDPVPRSELMKNIPNKDGLLCMLTDKIDQEVLEKSNKLKVIATMSVGLDHLNLPEIKKRQIKVGYTPDVLTPATAELTLGLLLATSRRLFEANAAARSGAWQAWAPFWMTGPGLENSTVGIAGFGRIGQEVAKLVKPFRVKKIIYFNRSQKQIAEEETGAVRVTFDELLGQSDFLIVCCALTKETEKMFNAVAFNKMKKTAVFINTSRGGLVNQEDLVKALHEKKIWGAGLDVMMPEPLPLDSPLFKLKNCVILPHIGSASIQTRDVMAVMSAQNIIAGLEGKPLPAELKL